MFFFMVGVITIYLRNPQHNKNINDPKKKKRRVSNIYLFCGFYYFCGLVVGMYIKKPENKMR